MSPTNAPRFRRHLAERFRRSDGKTTLFAHRGARVELPENTLEAFERALEVGADAVETDVHLSADGQVVIFHDDLATRIVGRPRPIADCALREIQSWDVGHVFVGPGGPRDRPLVGRGFRAPLLADALRAFPDAAFNVDLKPRSPALVAAAVALVHDLGVADRVLLTSFHASNVALARALGYRGPTGSATTDVARLLTRPWTRLEPSAHAGDAVQIPYRTGGLWMPIESCLARCRAIDARLDVFTVNDAALARSFVDIGVDGLMTDDPRTIARALGRAPTPSTEMTKRRAPEGDAPPVDRCS